MFGQSRPVPFNPYGRRARRGVPRWLVLLLAGIAIGVGGVVLVQERYLPPRLTAAASTQLQKSFQQTDAERQRLQAELGSTAKRLDAALADKKSLSDELAESRAATDRLHDDVAAVVASLPPDPRNGGVAVRAGRFTVVDGALAYDVVLTRERANGKAIPGVMQLVVAGASARGVASSVTTKPIAVSIGGHAIARGSVALPDGFRPRQATIQVLDRPAGRALGMRVMLVT